MPTRNRVIIPPGRMTATECQRFDSFANGLALGEVAAEVEKQEEKNGVAWDDTHRDYVAQIINLSIPQLIDHNAISDEDFYQAMVQVAAIAFRAIRAYHRTYHTFDQLIMDENNGTD